MQTDKMSVPSEDLFADAELMVALTEAWDDAKKADNSLTCRLLQDQMERLLTGKVMMIPIESKLNLRADLM